jgi:hypothetical protein
MITPEESGSLARIKEGYREWLQQARRASDERRIAARRHPDGGGRRQAEPPRLGGSPADRRS